jgi:hypothetical protein
MEREIIIANDWIQSFRDFRLRVRFYTFQFSPLPFFTYYQEGIPTMKKVYPSEGEIKLTDRKFDDIFFNDGDRGIYIKYGKTSPYPTGIAFGGSTIYANYTSTRIFGDDLYLSSADSLHISQYISVGNEETARNNINDYISVSLFPYPNGQVPIVLSSYIDSIESLAGERFNYVISAHEKIESEDITAYTEAINFEADPTSANRIDQIQKFGKNILACQNLYNIIFDSKSVQENKIQSIIDKWKNYYDITTEGFTPTYLRYNLDTIKVLNDLKISFAPVLSVKAPFYHLFQEGLRHPKMAYYQGNETGLVLLPISEPTSFFLRPEYETEGIIRDWKSTIDSVIENDDMCLFLWQSEHIGNPGYINKILDVVEYAKDRGLSFSTPNEIVRHFLLLRNVSANVSTDIDTVKISVTNGNDEFVNGAAFKIVMPKVNGYCPYIVENGGMERVVGTGENCWCYVSTDLTAGETKLLIIEPNITRRTFNVNLENLVEGDLTFVVTDDLDKPVQEVKLIINSTIHETDENGVVDVNLRRGKYELKLEKAGYVTENYVIDVRGRIYALASSTSIFYVIGLLFLILIYYFAKVYKKGKVIRLSLRAKPLKRGADENVVLHSNLKNLIKNVPGKLRERVVGIIRGGRYLEMLKYKMFYRDYSKNSIIKKVFDITIIILIIIIVAVILSLYA